MSNRELEIRGKLEFCKKHTYNLNMTLTKLKQCKIEDEELKNKMAEMSVEGKSIDEIIEYWKKNTKEPADIVNGVGEIKKTVPEKP